MGLVGDDEDIRTCAQNRMSCLSILQLKLLEGREEKLPTLSPEEISKIIDVVSMIRVTNQASNRNELIKELVVQITSVNLHHYGRVREGRLTANDANQKGHRHRLAGTRRVPNDTDPAISWFRERLEGLLDGQPDREELMILCALLSDHIVRLFEDHAKSRTYSRSRLFGRRPSTRVFMLPVVFASTVTPSIDFHGANHSIDEGH